MSAGLISRFQLRAAAVFREDRHVLLHRLEGDAFWALPGGRVEPGEAAAAAVVREMLEETNERVTGGELLFVVENFFVHSGVSYHEIGLYFAADLPPASRLRDRAVMHLGIEGERALEFRWFPLADLSRLDLRPAALVGALQTPGDGLRHLVQRS